ncbi:MAG TPA: glycosyl hydrolase family 17 protein [Candidatus Methylomirabilis sp.]|nr:glycosyl hydrolase family 17 protein [Candidatus Methylomirabilis sp.]
MRGRIATRTLRLGLVVGCLWAWSPAGSAAHAQSAFTDDPLVPRLSAIKAAHFMELRTAIDDLRARFGLKPFLFTDPVLTPRSTLIRLVHLTDLRTALAAVYQGAKKVPPSYTDPSPVVRQSIVEATHLSELRAAVHTLEQLLVPLTVKFLGSGSGTVAFDRPGSTCHLTCTERVVAGNEVTLQAQADTGTTFEGWGDSRCGMTNPCKLNVKTATEVTVTFSRPLGWPPAISNLKINPAIAEQGVGPVEVSGSVDFSDPDANVVRVRILLSGGPQVIEIPVTPGATTGVLTWPLGVDTATLGDMPFTVTAVDAKGNESNALPGKFQVVSPYIPVYRLHGLNFGPYVEGQDPDVGSQIGEGQLRARMRVIRSYTRWIRTFGSGNGLERAGQIAHDMGLNTAIGAWLGRDALANEREIANLIAAGKAGWVDLAIVGSEVLRRNDLSADQLIAYIARVKKELPEIQVTTAEIYPIYLEHQSLRAAVDVLFVNYYPYWEEVSVSQALAALHDRHQQVLALAGDKAVIVSESGWPSCGSPRGEAIPSPENASLYFLNFASWAQATQVEYHYFEAFDESWKVRQEGPQGACWGLWDKDGTLKAGMQDVFDGKTMPDNWSGTEVVGGPGIASISFTRVPPYGGSENLGGEVRHVRPADHRVAVYIKVGGRWWTKPTFAEPLTRIRPDGTWMCDITTGGIDEQATMIAAYLVPVGYSPPTMAGGVTLPAELAGRALAKVEITRAP